jgi:ABC-type transport system substrate-binding protein
MIVAGPAFAQKHGGILKLTHFDSPASMSMLEESTRATLQPMMGVFNNLVMYKQDVAQNSMESIVPDLATEWLWGEDGKELTFPLHQGVKWHDGRPFTSADVKCTWNLLLGKGDDKLRVNPRKSWYNNVEDMTTRGDYEVTFHLKQPQPALLALLASGWSPIYPCHIPAREMRQHPIGTGPFKFVEFKPNEHITVIRNPDYWKKDRPYLDGIEYTIMREAGPRNLAFFAGRFDAIPLSVTIPTLKDFNQQAPKATCVVRTGNVPRTLLVNPTKPPFDNAERRAMSLTFDRKAFLKILNEGQGGIGGYMMPPPDGAWGMPPEVLETLPGYGSDIEKNRAEARKIMEKLGYGPNITTERNLPRRRARSRGYGTLVRQDGAPGLHRRGRADRGRCRRSRPDVFREFHLWCAAQLRGLLQSRGGQAGEPAIGGGQSGKAQRTGLEDRAHDRRGRRPPGDLLSGRRDVLPALCQGSDADDQQHLQRLAHGRRLARPVAPNRNRPGAAERL